MIAAAYRDQVTGAYPITLATIRERAGVLFGAEPPKSVLDALAMDPVEAVDAPPYDPLTQTIAEGPPTLEGVVWRQTWLVAPIPPPPVPAEVTRRQAKIVLSRAGLLAQADATIAAMPGQAGEEARIDWADAAVFRRDNPLILALGAQFGLDAGSIDNLFRQATQIA